MKDVGWMNEIFNHLSIGYHRFGTKIIWQDENLIPDK
jgi:hypothetical protein